MKRFSGPFSFVTSRLRHRTTQRAQTLHATTTRQEIGAVGMTDQSEAAVASSEAAAEEGEEQPMADVEDRKDGDPTEGISTEDKGRMDSSVVVDPSTGEVAGTEDDIAADVIPPPKRKSHRPSLEVVKVKVDSFYDRASFKQELQVRRHIYKPYTAHVDYRRPLR